MLTQPTIDKLIDRLESDQASAQRVLDKFRADFDRTPKHALEWSGDAFDAAAVLGNTTELLVALNYVKERNDLTQVQADCLIRSLDQRFLQQIRGAGISSHSNGSCRMMAQAQADVSAGWYDDASWGSVVSRNWVAGVIQAQVQVVEPPAQPSSE